MRHKNTVYGLNTALTTLEGAITSEANARAAQVGELVNLETTDKTNIVAAINEVATASTSVSDSSLQIAANLSDLDDVVVARTNLAVYSQAEIDAAIADAKIALGTNFTVADIAARDALENLDIQDRVLVLDDGTGKWAQFKPLTFNETTGLGETWLKLADQDALANSITAPALKVAYESNEDTNAYTDADQLKVSYITVTEAIDLAEVMYKADLVQDLVGASGTATSASVTAIKSFALGAASIGGPTAIMEDVVVAGENITLTHAPRNGVNGILNFGTVRLMEDVEGTMLAYDAPVTATADDKVFKVETNTENQWDLKTVKVQYIYITPVSKSPV